MDKILGKVPMGEKIGYSLGDAAANLVFQMMMIYQLKFYTDVFGLEGAIAGTVLLIARIVDAFVDPAAGILSDKTQTKWGKFRPWVIWTALPFMVFYVLAFYNPGIENKALVAVYAGRSLAEKPATTKNTNPTTAKIVMVESHPCASSAPEPRPNL